MNKFMTNIKSSALWSIMALCALASCKSTDKKIREKNAEIKNIEYQINSIEMQKITLTLDSIRNNDSIQNFNTDSLRMVNDSLFNKAANEYYARLEKENNLKKFFTPSQVEEIRKTLIHAVKTGQIRQINEEAYNAARRIIAGIGSIYDFHCRINPAIIVANKDLADEIGTEIDPTTNSLIYHILSQQYRIDEAMAKRDLITAGANAKQIDADVLEAYAAESNSVRNQITDLMENQERNKKEIARLDKRLRKIQRNYGVEFADSGLQTKAAKKYIKLNNKDLETYDESYVPNYNLPEMQKIRSEWNKNQTIITKQERNNHNIIKGTEKHFDTVFQDTINALDKKRQELVNQRSDMMMQKIKSK